MSDSGDDLSFREAVPAKMALRMVMMLMTMMVIVANPAKNNPAKTFFSARLFPRRWRR